jgi:hypothetical protein
MEGSRASPETLLFLLEYETTLEVQQMQPDILQVFTSATVSHFTLEQPQSFSGYSYILPELTTVISFMRRNKAI